MDTDVILDIDAGVKMGVDIDMDSDMDMDMDMDMDLPTGVDRKVASLSDKNRRLTGLVRQLEADSCPNLDDVLNGLGDECHSSLILPTPASSSSSSSSPQCAVGVTKEKDHEDRYSHLHALNPTSSFLSCVPRVGQGGSGAVSVVSEADGIVDSMAGGVGEDTDGSGGGVTTDQAQSSSSESDFDVSV